MWTLGRALPDHEHIPYYFCRIPIPSDMFHVVCNMQAYTVAWCRLSDITPISYVRGIGISTWTNMMEGSVFNANHNDRK